MRTKVFSWLQKYKKYFFSHRDGFFELPFIANSPELMVESFSNMPFMKNFSKQGFFQTNNLFIKGEGHYQKIEDGLWIIMSDIEIKRDLSFKLYYLDNEPSNYHFLTLYLNKGSKKIKFPKLQLDIENIDRTWTLFKAGADCLNTHFKGQHSIFFSIYFTSDWLKKNTNGNFESHLNELNSFLDSENEYVFFTDLLGNNKEVYEAAVNAMLNKDNNGIRDLDILIKSTYQIIQNFILEFRKESTMKNGPSLSERNKRRVLYAKYLLENSLFEKFPSITTIAKLTGVSETKIKADFKNLLGKSMLQYYIMQQMIYAKNILKTEKLTIKEVSEILGYSSPSKFTEAFKKYHGIVPSEIVREESNELAVQ